MDGGLGFKDFEAFNHALLAKQCWKLINSEDSLCYKVLKSKYFPTTSFVHANLGSRPSFIWRSLMTGKEVILEGSQWRVGNGIQIDVWKDKWVNKPPLYQIHATNESLYPNLCVSQLIDRDRSCWNMELIDQVFTFDEAALIQKIHLSHRFPSDKLIWIDSTTADFMVRSAYCVARLRLGNTLPPRDNRVLVWQLLWKTSVYQSVLLPKRFIWQRNLSSSTIRQPTHQF